MKRETPESATPDEQPEMDAESAAFAEEHADLINGLLGDLGGMLRELPEEDRQNLEHPVDAFFKIAERLPSEEGTSDGGDAFACPQCGHTIAEDEDACSQCGWTFMK